MNTIITLLYYYNKRRVINILDIVSIAYHSYLWISCG